MTGLRVVNPGVWSIGTGTSLALGGATIGSDALAVTGSAAISGTLMAGSIGLNGTTGSSTAPVVSSISSNNQISFLNTNTNTGTSARASNSVANSASGNNRFVMSAVSSGFTNAYPFMQSAGVLETGSGLTGGLRIATRSTAVISLGINSAEVAQVTALGHRTMISQTVAALPAAAAGNTGVRTFVTDALAPAFATLVAGGGAVFTPVYSDGTIWRCG